MIGVMDNCTRKGSTVIFRWPHIEQDMFYADGLSNKKLIDIWKKIQSVRFLGFEKLM